MECFSDRTDAGQLLAELLLPYHDREDLLVLGLPRGGVPVAIEVATLLRVPLDVMVVQKISAPKQPDFIVGAIATGGVLALNEDVAGLCLETPEFRSEAIREGIEMKRRELLYRGHRAPPRLSGRTAILVDDGAATGVSMRVAIRAARALGACRIVVAVGVAPKETYQSLRVDADEVVCARVAEFFCSVEQWYREVTQGNDAEIAGIADRFTRSRVPSAHSSLPLHHSSAVRTPSFP